MKASRTFLKTAATLCACLAIAAGTMTAADRSAPPVESTLAARAAAQTSHGAEQADSADITCADTTGALPGAAREPGAPPQTAPTAVPSASPALIPPAVESFIDSVPLPLENIGRLVTSYMAGERFVQVYLEDLPAGGKELVLNITEPDGSDRVFRTGIAVDEDNCLLFGLNGKGLLNTGFNFDYRQTILYYSDVVFQRNYGYCELYDILAPLISADFLTVRFKFEYAGMDWMIQFWKGIYFFNTTGGEVGVYNKPQSRPCEFYDCGRDEDKMPISVTVLRGDEVIFHKPLENCWWQTGFALREPSPKEELTLQSTLVFPTEAMKTAFLGAVDAAAAEGFAYTVDGNAVSIVW